MSAALPRLKAQPIPGGTIEPPAPASDPIGDLVDGIADAIGGQPAAPAEKAPADDVPF